MREENGHGPSLTGRCNHFSWARVFGAVTLAPCALARRGAVRGDDAQAVHRDQPGRPAVLCGAGTRDQEHATVTNRTCRYEAAAGPGGQDPAQAAVGDTVGGDPLGGDHGEHAAVQEPQHAVRPVLREPPGGPGQGPVPADGAPVVPCDVGDQSVVPEGDGAPRARGAPPADGGPRARTSSGRVRSPCRRPRRRPGPSAAGLPTTERPVRALPRARGARAGLRTGRGGPGGPRRPAPRRLRRAAREPSGGGPRRAAPGEVRRGHPPARTGRTAGRSGCSMRGARTSARNRRPARSRSSRRVRVRRFPRTRRSARTRRSGRTVSPRPAQWPLLPPPPPLPGLRRRA